MSNSKSLNIVLGPKLPKGIPKLSLGKYMFDRLKQGNQNVALIDAHTGMTLSYDQILQRSVKLALCYKKYNIKKGDVIAILSENNINYIIPILAALYVGAIAHPINCDLTLAELSELFRVSQPKWIFCSEMVLPSAEQLKIHFKCIQMITTFGTKSDSATTLEELLDANGIDTTNFEPEEVHPEEDVAYIFCSSGTSGMPKCTMLTHYNAVTAMKVKYAYIKQEDTTLVPTPFCHIYGFSYLQLSLAKLGRFVVMKKFIPELYLKSIELYKVNLTPCPPLLLKFLAQSRLVDLYDLSSITDITYGSAPSDPAIDSIIRKRLHVTPRQIYGATETFAGCIITPFELSKPGSIGILCHELIAKVCDVETQEILGSNRPGEICIKGPLVMKGYMQNPEETRNCIDSDGFYHTGDIGYYDEDKYFFLIGRIKELIKYKGYQVSPMELENLILKHNAINEVAVIGIPDERAGEVPLAYVVVKEKYTNGVTESEIVDFVAERISSTKRLYGGVKFVKEIPKNKNGKVVKRILREMYDKFLPA